MRFEILGPIRAVLHDREVAITAGRDAALLALLLLDANRTVSMDRLVDALWADTAPKDARNQLHVCMSRLRRLLARADARSQPIATDPAGYRIRASTETLDLLQFRALVADARAAASAGHHEQARDRYRAALGLWRGPALAGIDRPTVRRAATALDEERAQALEERIDVELAVGASGELVGELTDLIQRYPYRERLHAALMIALYRADRQADALAAYQRIRQNLVTDLGQEPGPVLRELHHRILIGDDALRPRSSGRGRGAQAATCLPRAIPDFTGRKADLAWLLEKASEADAFAPVVLAIDGMPGVGKTSLAIRAAHELAPSFPDGQLFVDLHGHSEHHPLDPAVALGNLLRQLGVFAAHIPTDFDERIAHWRAELADRRVLVVLDNATSSAQVAPLLPATPGCLTLVTSRRRLVDLDAARPRSVGLLDPEDAVALLERVAGDRVRAEPEAAAEVAKRCGYLPLTLRLAAARLAHRPYWRVRDLADRLADPRTPLMELAAGDRTVADTFELSYVHLTPAGQRMFRLLGLHPGETFDAHAAAAVANVNLRYARTLLDELVDCHLVHEYPTNRYRLHDLLKSYASNLAETAEAEGDRQIAIEHLLDYYLHAAAVACSSLETPASLRNLHLGAPIRTDLLEGLGALDMEWLELERRNLVAAVHLSVARSQHHYAWRIARAIWRFLYLRGHLDDIVDAYRRGLAAAEVLGDAAAAATMHNYLAAAFYRYGLWDQAIWHLERYGHITRRAARDRVEEAAVNRQLALLYADAGQYPEAAAACDQALSSARISGDPYTLALAVVNAGHIYLLLGRHQEALAYSRRGLALARAHGGNDRLIASALAHVAMARARLGQPHAALRLLIAALKGRKRAKDGYGEAETLNELGVVCRKVGRVDAAAAHHRQALAMMRERGYRQGECVVYNDFARTLWESRDVVGALELYRRALEGATKLHHKYNESRALDGIAACLRDTDPESARRHWVRALQLYRELDVPERHEVERHLAELDLERPV